jgi:hypothetical protein
MTFKDEELDLDDPDLDIPELDESFWDRAVTGWYWDKVKDGYDIAIDGAIGYRLRLIPSNKILAIAPTAREVFRAYLDEVARGRAPRTMVVDWCWADGRTGVLKAGRGLAQTAQASVHGAKTLPQNAAYVAERDRNGR